MASSSGSMYRAPGREHLDRRVERVRRMAPGKRSTEEAAFLEGAELIAEVQALLPMVRDAARPTRWNPAPEAGDGVAARRRHLLAFAKFARADCIGPQLSPYRHEAEYALKGYFWHLSPEAVGRQCACCAGGQHGGAPASPRKDECMQLLADVLGRYSVATESIRSDGSNSRKVWAMSRMEECHWLLNQLASAETRRAVDTQLAQLAMSQEQPQELVTADELRLATCFRMGNFVTALMLDMPQQLSPAEQGSIWSWAQRAAALLDELAPDCPKAMYSAAQLLSAGMQALNLAVGRSRRPTQREEQQMAALQQAVQERYQRGWEGAKKRSSDLHMATIGLNWLVFAANNPPSAGQQLVEAAAAAGPEAVDALKRCRRNLPDTWTVPLQDVADIARRQLLPTLKAQLDYWQRGGTLEGVRAKQAGVSQAVQQLNQAPQDKYRCDACGQYSLALRACSACKSAKYCSRECQVKGWKAGHKNNCVAAK